MVQARVQARQQARQQAVSEPASLVESATSTVSVVSSATPIETVSVPQSRLGKTKHGGVYLSTGIKHWNKDLLHSCHY
jgi:hypothetical protein